MDARPFSFTVSTFTTNIEGTVPVKQVRKLTLMVTCPRTQSSSNNRLAEFTQPSLTLKPILLLITKMLLYIFIDYVPIMNQEHYFHFTNEQRLRGSDNFLKVIKPWWSMNNIKMQLDWTPNLDTVPVSCYIEFCTQNSI